MSRVLGDVQFLTFYINLFMTCKISHRIKAIIGSVCMCDPCSSFSLSLECGYLGGYLHNGATHTHHPTNKSGLPFIFHVLSLTSTFNYFSWMMDCRLFTCLEGDCGFTRGPVLSRSFTELRVPPISLALSFFWQPCLLLSSSLPVYFLNCTVTHNVCPFINLPRSTFSS